MIQKTVARIAAQLTRNETLQKDLTQDALVHLWQLERKRPDQTRSWYLQSCRFHLQHVLSTGRSVDSGKRRAQQVEAPHEGDNYQVLISLRAHDSGVDEQIAARDMMEVLMMRLARREGQVLTLLAAGFNLCEVARALTISYPTALKSRRMIAAQVSKLDRSPLRPGRAERSPKKAALRLALKNARTQLRADHP